MDLEEKNQNIRMVQRDNPPGDSDVSKWIGKEAYKYWKQIAAHISQNYPNVFTPEWLYGGKKHGWSLRYKKSKSFCTFVPEKNRFALLIVFGADERAKVGTIRGSLSKGTQKEYDKATTYHDGKWLLLAIDSDKVVEDAVKLLSIKRKHKNL
ncbi:MAG: DUF3788 domain-containing protein [Sedimentisphaerales bacterium]|nr:DUF3788 domain-containing protein [Sedimentisphaerales bacterium]